MSWSRRFDIPEKRELTVKEMSDGSLRIIPGDLEKRHEEVKIPILKDDTEDEIYYRILRKYLEAYKKIILVGNLTDEQMDFIQVIHRRIVGLEVTEQKKDEIILTDLLKPEDVDLDKVVNQMFSFTIAMTNDIIAHIEQGKSPRDKILDRDSVTTRNHNLAYRCCTMALKDSIYLGKLKKTTKEILILSRVIRYLDMIGTILVGISYLINTEMTEGMKKYHYKAFEKDEKLNKKLGKYLNKWLKYFRSTKKVLKKKNAKKATELYLQRFDFRFSPDIKGVKSTEHLTNVVDLTEQLNRMSSLILRDFMMY
jgi:phosphate uptake regulator